MGKKPLLGEMRKLFFLLCAAGLSFCALHIFIIPSNFSPSGVDGVSTLLYEVTGISAGVYKLAINLPLMVLAWIYMKRRYVIYVTLFTLADSLGLILLESVGFFTFIPTGLPPENALCYRLICALCAGVCMGGSTALMLKIGASTGGVDIAAALIGKKFRNFPIERWISIICCCVVGISYFVYWDVTSILLSVIQIFVFEWTSSTLLRNDRYAVEVKIITDEPDLIRNEILYTFHHSATILNAEGMFTGEKRYMVVTVLNKRDIFPFMNMMKSYPDTFVYFNEDVKVQGAFHFGDKNSKQIDAF